MFDKILIANRGEIAVRIIKACREMNIATVAVYSEVDRQSQHALLADEAVLVGPAPAPQSYLVMDHILAAARATGAQAIHPGYGFLSENAAFAQAVQDGGLVFIGPSPQAIRAMGDKAEARARVESAGVPVVPGYQGPDDMPALEQAARDLGYPVLVKAAAGGGGKGMRVVWEASALVESVQAARREARHAFNDERLILERYIPQARHIEFQILADQHGNTLHLFERECSVQRRHQKIIEETPSPFLDEDLRQQMGRMAVAAAQAVGYTNAGTIEFIVDHHTRQFYFLEMNTRLQVEHPVTELVTGIDLVRWQLRIAAGERLTFGQNDLQQRGHAIECRLYAEDVAAGFLPASGPLLTFKEPEGPGIRVDSGYVSGDEVSLHYDPLLAKVIVSAGDRPAAVERMLAALRYMVILGVTTNWQFLEDVLAHPDFQAGQVFTTWVEQEFAGWQHPQCALPPEVLAAAALTQFQTQPGRSNPADTPDAFNPWKAWNNFRMGETK